MAFFDDEGPTLEKMVAKGCPKGSQGSQNGAQNEAKSMKNGGLGEALLPNGSPGVPRSHLE